MKNGISAAKLLRACQCAETHEAEAMSNAAALMHAGEPIPVEEWEAAHQALHSVQRRAMAKFVGPIRLNRFGRPFGGRHPAEI